MKQTLNYPNGTVFLHKMHENYRIVLVDAKQNLFSGVDALGRQFTNEKVFIGDRHYVETKK